VIPEKEFYGQIANLPINEKARKIINKTASKRVIYETLSNCAINWRFETLLNSIFGYRFLAEIEYKYPAPVAS
jgi:hypothetical protein